MRVLVAGASGVIGRAVVSVLAGGGHDVVALSRRPAADTGPGVTAIRADVFDRNSLTATVRDAGPDAVVNLLTAIPGRLNARKMAQEFALTNRLRTEGTRNLIDAAQEAGAYRIIAEGLAYAYDPGRRTPATEDDPFWRTPPKQFVPVLAAIVELERLTTAAGGLVLRLGHLYGPGSVYDAHGSTTDQVRAGKMPLVGGGTAVFSFIHAHDVATAVAAALDSDVTGALNVVDDDPAPVSAWLPVLAGLVDGPAPKPAPRLLARLAVGGWGVAYMTELRGASNARAKAALDWRPRYPSWREGFATELAPAAASG